MMSRIAIAIKSFRGDLSYIPRLLESLHRHNVDELPILMIIPASDFSVFESLGDSRIEILVQEDFAQTLITQGENSSMGSEQIGYINQGIAKLSLAHSGQAQNYFVVDSDTEFIADFREADFFHNSGAPYTAASEYSDLKADDFYFERYWEYLDHEYEKARQVLCVKDSRRLRTHNSQVFSAVALAELEDFLSEKHNWTLRDAMQHCQAEFFWYTAWMQVQSTVPFIQKSDFVKMVNHQGEHLALKSLVQSNSSLARGYLGVIVNSNWSRQYGLVSYDTPLTTEYFRRGKWSEWEKSR